MSKICVFSSVIRKLKILDVRSPQEVLKYGKVPNSLNISYELLRSNFEKEMRMSSIKNNDIVVVYCQTGKRSRHIKWLGRMYGYQVFDFGGFKQRNIKDFFV